MLDYDDDPFVKSYMVQRLIRKACFEEYKIHSFNFILLLFESCVRIQTTLAMQKGAKDDINFPEPKVAEQYFSKNYKRFLEHR